MDLRESLNMAVKTLTANKLRSTLTMLGIIIGNASVIAMVGIGKGAQDFVAQEIESLGPNVLFVVPGNQETQRATFNVPKTLVLEDAIAIQDQVASVQGVAPEYNDRGLITYRNRSATETIVGTTPGFPIVRNTTIERGQFITEDDMRRSAPVAVLGASLAERLFQEQEAIGQRVRVKNVSFEVIGVLEEKGSSLGGVNYDDVVLVPLTTLSERIVGRTSPYGVELTYLAVSVAEESKMSAAEFQITNLLRLRHNITDRKSVV